jgi:outer membrane protein TolC
MMKLLALLVAAALSTAAGAQEKPPKEQAEASAKKIRELRKERITVLGKVVDQATAQFQRAQGSYEEVLEAQVLLLQARLDAAEKESDRIELYEQAVELLKQVEKVAAARVEAGRGTELAVHKIRARRLEVEIRLEQAKLKGRE